MISSRLQDFRENVITPEIVQNRQDMHIEVGKDFEAVIKKIDSLQNSYNVDRLKKDFSKTEILELKTKMNSTFSQLE